MTKLSELLELYLDEYSRQKSDYYDNLVIGSRMTGYLHMQELAEEMENLIREDKNEITNNRS